MTPGEFDEWMAFRQLEPDPEDRRAEILKRGFAMLAAAFSGQQIDINILDPKPHEEQIATPNQAAQVAAMSLGAPHGHGNRRSSN